MAVGLEAAGEGGRLVTVATGLPRSGTRLAIQWLKAAVIPTHNGGQRAPDAPNPWGFCEVEIVQSPPAAGD